MDVERAYELGANSLVVKPFDFGELHQIVREIAAYWLECCKLPSSARYEVVGDPPRQEREQVAVAGGLGDCRDASSR